MMPDEERLRDLLRRAAADPPPVDFASVERGARRRRTRNLAAATVAVKVLLGAGVAAAAQLGSSDSNGEPVLVGPTRSGSCPAFEPYQIDQAQMQHTSSEADRVVTASFPNDSLVETFPVLVADPVAPKVGLGSATTPRKMWVAVRRQVATARPPGSLGPPGATPGTVSIVATLVDDETLQLGGNLGCGVPASPPAAPDNHSGTGAAAPPCTSKQVHLDVRYGGAASGEAEDVVVVTNTSSHTCSLRGYAGLSFRNAVKRVPVSVVHQQTYLFAPAPVKTLLLTHGDVASFLFAYSEYSQPNGSGPCLDINAVAVTLPGDTAAMTTPLSPHELTRPCTAWVDEQAFSPGAHGLMPSARAG
jgi:hypothetical protein